MGTTPTKSGRQTSYYKAFNVAAIIDVFFDRLLAGLYIQFIVPKYSLQL